MNVELRPLGCMGCVGSILSLGLLPLLLRQQEGQFPKTLSDDGIRTRNGRLVEWVAIQRARASEVFFRGRYAHTLYELWHSGGRLHFPSHRVVNITPVIQHILQHLPAGVRFEQGRPVNFRPWIRKDRVT